MGKIYRNGNILESFKQSKGQNYYKLKNNLIKYEQYNKQYNLQASTTTSTLLPQHNMQPIQVFKTYPSLTQCQKTKFLNNIRKLGHADPSIRWVATEKIHGANFSVYCNGKFIRYGRRNDFITKVIPVGEQKIDKFFLEEFLNANRLVTRFHNKLPELYADIVKRYPEVESFQVYGEYFGANWTTKEGDWRAVQFGVHYTPQHEYFAFDLLLTMRDGTEFWADVEDLDGILGKYIRVVPIYAKGTFQQMIAINTVIDSTIPELLGLPKLSPNIIEGMVIRPNKNIQVGDERIVIKKKNQEFMEKAYAPNPNKLKNKKKQGETAEEKQQKEDEVQKQKDLEKEALEFYSLYLNVNRIQSVVSKFPNLKDRMELKKKILKDMLEDIANEQLEQQPKEIPAKVLAELQKRIFRELANYFNAQKD